MAASANFLCASRVVQGLDSAFDSIIIEE